MWAEKWISTNEVRWRWYRCQCLERIRAIDFHILLAGDDLMWSSYSVLEDLTELGETNKVGKVSQSLSNTSGDKCHVAPIHRCHLKICAANLVGRGPKFSSQKTYVPPIPTKRKKRSSSPGRLVWTFHQFRKASDAHLTNPMDIHAVF